MWGWGAGREREREIREFLVLGTYNFKSESRWFFLGFFFDDVMQPPVIRSFYKKPVIPILYRDDEERKTQKCEVVCSCRQLGGGTRGRFSASPTNTLSNSRSCYSVSSWRHYQSFSIWIMHVSGSEPLRCASRYLLSRQSDTDFSCHVLGHWPHKVILPPSLVLSSNLLLFLSFLAQLPQISMVFSPLVEVSQMWRTGTAFLWKAGCYAGSAPSWSRGTGAWAPAQVPSFSTVSWASGP